MKRTQEFEAVLDRFRVPVRLTYLGILFLATLSWYRLDLDPVAILERLRRMWDPSVSARDAIDGVRNVLLFAGWGLVWMITAAPGRSAVALRNAVATGAGLSLFVEALQLLSARRTASVLDLATNTAGAALGATVLVAVVMATAGRRGGKSFVGVPAAIFAVSSALALAGEALVPLYRQEIQPWANGGPLQRLFAALDRSGWGPLGEWPLGDGLLFLPGGVFLVASLSESGISYRRAAILAVAGALFVFAGAEVAHGVLGMAIRWDAAAVHVVAFSVGAAVAARALPAFTRAFRGVQRPRVLLGVYVAWLFLWTLRPYAPESSLDAVVGKLASEWWIPLRSLGMRVDMFSVVDVVAGFFLALPLGALLAVWPVRLRGWLASFLPALYLVTTLELAQAVVLTRTLDITDALLQAAGAAIGWAVVRRAGFAPYGSQLPRRP